MKTIKFIFTSLGVMVFLQFGFSQTITKTKPIKGGYITSLYGLDSARTYVDDFELDEYAVTNAQFLEFVKKNPEWQKSKVKALFADKRYLNDWVSDTSLSPNMNPQSPVTNVSWFVAKAYCEFEGKRLPTMDEWEYAALASETQKNAENDSLFNQRIVESYETPRTYQKEIGSTYKNYWGIYDLHGLIWEWTSDFNSVLITGESRNDGSADRDLFCAGAAIDASDLRDYAAFMRYAFRGSIKANYNIQNLGFRCAKK